MDLFKILGTIAIDNQSANNEIDETTEHAENAESKMGKAFKKIATAIAAAFAVEKIISWTKALGQATFDAYANYEQLAGGAKLMFGEAYDFVAEKAANAYKTVQMSQNEYLEQVNGFATGLKTALGGNETAAAELADKILTAEADIVAATGNTQENVQNAFNGIMKSNYTMLDNLQLGIKPTKEGMQEVIDKVNAWNTANGEATSYQIDNLADCQAALVDYVEMQGLAGYAANEAADTIQGSMSMLGSAWQNMLVGIADENQEIAPLFQNLWDSFMTAAGNVVPRIGQMILGFGEFVKMAAPKVIEQAKKMFSSFSLDSIVEFSRGMLEGSQTFVKSGMKLLQDIAQGIADKMPEFISKAPIIIGNFADMLNQNAPTILAGGVKIVITLAKGIIKAIPTLVKSIPVIIKAAVKVWTAFSWASLGRTMITKVSGGVQQAAKALLDKVKNIINKIKGFFKVKISAPHIPLPHFSITPAGWKLGDLVKGKIPSLGIKWHAKGGIFDKPTIFNTASGLHGVGEAGAEAVTPISKLQEYVSAAVADQNAMLLQGLREIMAGQGYTFNIATQVDGKQIAIATAKYTQDQLNKLQTRSNRLVGVR